MAVMFLDTKVRVTVLETILGVPTKREQLSVCDKFEALAAETLVVRNELTKQRSVILMRVEELDTTLETQSIAIRETTSQFKTVIAC